MAHIFSALLLVRDIFVHLKSARSLKLNLSIKHSMKMVVQNTYYECAGRHFDDVIVQPITHELV